MVDCPSPDASPASKRTSNAEVRGLRSDLELLLKELDFERRSYSKLEQIAESAQREASKTQEKLAAAQKQIKDLKRGRRSKTAVDDAETDIEDVLERMSNLKNARDRLIEALDAQTAETERFAIENSALASAVYEARQTAALWESQAQEALTQSHHLRDLLEESAQWMEEKAKEEVMTLQAKCAALEVQVRALVAELTRVVTDSTGLHRATQPLLSDVESKLMALVVHKNRLAVRYEDEDGSGDPRDTIPAVR